MTILDATEVKGDSICGLRFGNFEDFKDLRA
jgi:hypothetical protein